MHDDCQCRSKRQGLYSQGEGWNGNWGQNAWPSLEHDFYSIFDRLSFLFPAGFQYRRFIRPRFLWPITEKVIRRMAGLGKLPSTDLTEHSKPTKELSPDVLVVGGGPAGLNAALNSGKIGANTVLIDDGLKLGGRFRLQTSQVTFPPWEGLRGFQVCERLTDELLVVRPKKIIIAAGCNDRPLVFPNNDLPGIFLPVGIQRLIHDYGVLPGQKAVIATNNEFGYELADDMIASGVEVNAICDERRNPTASTRRVRQVLVGSTIAGAAGRRSLSAVQIKISDGIVSIPCDVLCVAFGTTLSNELLLQLGCDLKYSLTVGGHVPSRDIHMLAGENCYAVGAAAGVMGLHSVLLEGAIAGAAACHSLGVGKEMAASIINSAMSELDGIREARTQ